MIRTLLRIGWLNLARDRVAQAMTFILPISFFSIFAMIFGGTGRGETASLPVAVVDEDRSGVSARLIRALEKERGLRIVLTAKSPGAANGAPEVTLDRARAEQMVRDGDLSVALVVPAGFDSSFGRFDGRGRPVLMLTDPSDPVAPQVAAGLMQKAAMTSAPDVLARNGLVLFDRYSGGLTPKQRQASESWMKLLRARADAESAADARGDTAMNATDRGDGFAGLVTIEERKVVGGKKTNGMVSFYAAGIAVMFLLFSASAAGGSLLDEVESGTLDRVLTTRVGMTGLLAGKWLSLIRLGVLQIVVMFLWATFVFKLDLWTHLPGFAVMTLATAATAASFGLVLATACKTRQQLSGISTIVILTISALGGSMFPRFLMSETMQKIGLVSFNAWALDGFVKVFWRDARMVELLPQLGVLAAWTVGLLIIARLLARRWEMS